MRKKIIIILFLVVCVGSGYFVAKKFNKSSTISQQSVTVSPDITLSQTQNSNLQAISDASSSQPTQTQQSYDPQISQKTKQNVPFIVQAPFANWKDPIFQNACEEASMVMAMGWTSGSVTISAQDAEKQIKSIVTFENKKFGYNADTNIQDMQVVFQDFFHYQNISIQENINLADIKNEIQKGNIILVPAFGRALGNPNYTAPGPVAHMLVIIGYDPSAKEFITNDPGTRHGSGYLYSEDVLFNAIWEYPRGAKVPQPPKNARRKGMLVVVKL